MQENINTWGVAFGHHKYARECLRARVVIKVFIVRAGVIPLVALFGVNQRF